MNICILSKVTIAHSIGGMQIHCKTLSEEMVNRGHKVTIVTTAHPKAKEFEESGGVGIFYLKGTRSGTYRGGWWRESVNKLEELHRSESFDIILSESVSAYSYVLRAKRNLKIPLISIIQGYSVKGDILSEWNRSSTLGEYLRFFGVRLPEYLFCYYPWFGRTLKNSDAVIGVSKETASAIREEFSLPEEKVFFVFNSVDTNLFKPDEKKRGALRNKYGVNRDEKLIFMSGVVHKQKGMHIGLQAFIKLKEKFQDVKLLVAGDGPYLAKLKQIAARSNAGKAVVFCGSVPNNELPGYYSACDVYLNPTLRWEGLPIATVEAVACGKPSVVSAIGGVLSVVRDGFNGFVIPYGKTEMFADKVLEILSNETLAAKFAANARRKAEEEFSKDKMTSDYLEICAKLTAQNN